MEKKTRVFRVFAIAIAAIVLVVACFVIDKPQEDLVGTVTLTQGIPSVEPTLVPTEIPEVPTVVPTVTVAPTATLEPTLTSVPMPTVAPTQASTPTPTPTPVVEEGVKPEYKFQVGDNVWYEYYPTGQRWSVFTEDYYDVYKLVITGTGAVENLENRGSLSSILDGQYYFKEYTCVVEIVICEGITRVGDYTLVAMRSVEKVSLPNTLESIGVNAFFEAGKNYSGVTEWVNLDLTKLDVANDAFLGANGIAGLEGGSSVMCTPTPTSTPVPPTPTPTPNPNKPRLVLSEKMGDNVTFDFYDNGYLYVRGTGAMWNEERGFSWLYREQKFGLETLKYGYFSQEFLNTIDYLIIEEGITEMGSWVFNGLDFNHIELPKSLKAIEQQIGINLIDASNQNVYIHAYLGGKEFTIKAKGADGKETVGYNFFFDFQHLQKYIHDDNEVKFYQMTVTWH